MGHEKSTTLNEHKQLRTADSMENAMSGKVLDRPNKQAIHVTTKIPCSKVARHSIRFYDFCFGRKGPLYIAHPGMPMTRVRMILVFSWRAPLPIDLFLQPAIELVKTPANPAFLAADQYLQSREHGARTKSRYRGNDRR